MIIKIITPREIELKITNARSQKLTQGSEIWLEGKIIMMLSKRSKWHSIITSYSVSLAISQITVIMKFKAVTHGIAIRRQLERIMQIACRLNGYSIAHL